MLAAAVPAFILFIWSQRRKDRSDGSALIQPSLFKVRSFAPGLGINLLFQIAMAGFFLTFALFAQVGLGFSALHAAVTGLPISAGITFTMIVLGRKFIPGLGRKAILYGALIMSVGLTILTATIFNVGIGINSWQMVPGLLIAGVGMGFMFGALYTAVLNGVDIKHAGSASGTLSAVQQVGAAMGIAIIGVVFFGQLSSGAANHFDDVAPKIQAGLTQLQIPESAQGVIIENTKACFVDRAQEKDATIVPASCKALSEGSGTTVPGLVDIVTDNIKEANTINFQNAFRWAIMYEVGFVILSIGLVFLLPKKFNHDDTIIR